MNAKTLACLILLGSVTSCERQRIPEPLYEQRVLPSEGYEQLERIVLRNVGSLCDSQSQCEPFSIPIAAIAGNRWLAVYVDENQRPQLQVADLATGVRRPLGAVGSGPGEYRFLTALAVDDSGDVTALDPTQRRVLRYSPMGIHRGTVMVEIPRGLIASWLGSRGAVFVATDPRATRADSAAVAVYRYDARTQKLNYVIGLPVRERLWGMSDMRPVPAAFSASPIWASDGRGTVYYSSGAEFVVAAYREDSSAALRFGFDVTPRAVTSKDLEHSLARGVAGISDPILRGAILASRKGASARHPAVTRIVPLLNGEIWIRESPREAGDSVQWVAFRTEDGSPIGRAMLGVDDEILASSDDRLLLSAAVGPGSQAEFRWMMARRPGQR